MMILCLWIWDLWSFPPDITTCDPSLLTPRAHVCFLDIACLEQSLPLLLRLLQPRWDRFLCSKGASGILIAYCRAGLTAVAASLWPTALPHHLKLCTRSSIKYLPALPSKPWAILSVWHTLHLLADGVTKNNIFGGLPGSRIGSTFATTQLGRCCEWQMWWMEKLSAAGEGRNCPVDFDWGLILLPGDPWLLSGGELSMSLSQIYLSSYYYRKWHISPRTLWQYSICIFTGILWDMALIPFNSWYSIQFNSFRYNNWVLRGWIARIALWRQTWHMFSEIILCSSGAFKILFLHGNYTLIIILS